MTPKTKQTILLVEDNPGDARLMREYLSEPGAMEFTLEEADLLGTGLDRLARGNIDIVLLDLSLPDSVGLNTFTRVQICAPEVPIIVLSGQDDEALAMRTVHEGAQDYLVKGQGLDSRLLVRAIRYAIERKRAEEALAKERDLLHILLNSLPDRIYFKDSHSRFLRISRAVAEQFGIADPRDAIGKTDGDFFAREHAEAAREDEQHIMATRQPILGKIEKETLPDGRVTWALTSKLPLQDKQGRTVGTFGISRDVTELHQANAELGRKQAELQRALSQLQKSHAELKSAQFQLIQAEKMQSLGQLAAGVAHEVKNPLAILGMGIEYLDKNLVSSDENVGVILSDMAEACKRANSILQDMLDFSMPRALDLKAENLNAILEHSLWLVRRELSANDLQIAKELAADLPLLKLDRNKIQQVFLNLLTNAIQAMAAGGTLGVRTYPRELAPGEINPEAERRFGDRFRAGETIVVAEVLDTGTGIPEDKLVKIFDPFFTTKPAGKGTGLGLTVSKKIVELHSGRMEIRNRSGGGVVATLWFKV